MKPGEFARCRVIELQAIGANPIAPQQDTKGESNDSF